MPHIHLVRDTSLPPAEAFERLTTWSRHGDFVPLTRVSVTPDGFVAHTGLFGIGFEDPMVMTDCRPPEYCRLEKRGRLVMGWAEIRVRPTEAGSRVQWTEEIRVRGVPRLFDPIVRRAGERMFSRLIDGLLSQRRT